MSLYASPYFKKVISFEPVKKIYNQFNKSVEMGGQMTNIETHSLACSDKKGRMEIYKIHKNMVESSLTPRESYDKKEKIKTIKLDDYLEGIS